MAAPVTTTTVTVPAPTSTTAAAVRSGSPTTTVLPMSTTTTAPTPKRTWSISPTSGPANTQITMEGTGCEGPNAGVSITYFDPSGQAYNGDGGAARPDGTWTLPGSVGAVPPGNYAIEASCGGGPAPFVYAPRLVFTVTG